MGYPMTWQRLISRAGLASEDNSDTARLMADSRDPTHLAEYAEIAGIEPEHVKRVLDAFFSGIWDSQQSKLLHDWDHMTPSRSMAYARRWAKDVAEELQMVERRLEMLMDRAAKAKGQFAALSERSGT